MPSMIHFRDFISQLKPLRGENGADVTHFELNISVGAKNWFPVAVTSAISLIDYIAVLAVHTSAFIPNYHLQSVLHP